MATYYVRSSGGSDGNAGTSFALGWATVQYAADHVASTGGDLVLVCNDGTHLPALTVDFDTNAGTVTNPNVFRGASATGNDNGTQIAISGANLPASSDLINLNIDSLGIKFDGIRFTAATLNNISLGAAINAGFITFANCRSDNAAGDGVYDQETTSSLVLTWINCEIDNNGGLGIDSSGSGRGGHKMVACSIHDNTGAGIEETAGIYPKSSFIGCLFYDNGGDGLVFTAACSGAQIIGNVFFGNTGDGLDLGSGYGTQLTIANNIFRSNGGYGINTNTATDGIFAFIDYNCYSNNTSGHIDIDSGTPPGSDNVLDNPDFTSETDGSEDFTLQTGSPCLDVGLGYNG